MLQLHSYDKVYLTSIVDGKIGSNANNEVYLTSIVDGKIGSNANNDNLVT